MGGRCSRSRQCYEDAHAGGEDTSGDANLGRSGGGSGPCGVQKLPAPLDDIPTDVHALGESEFAIAGVDGWVHVYDWENPRLVGRFRAHSKGGVNKLRPWRNKLLTASGDCTVRMWHGEWEGEAESEVAADPLLIFQGHQMSVRALDVLDGSAGVGADAGGCGESSPQLLTGSRDCSVRLWDLVTGAVLQQHKILRNVVTAIRCLPGDAHTAVQTSEDLRLRLWDARLALKPVCEVRSGPNQLICLDIAEDGCTVACGSKGFSRESCEVKVFDIRNGLSELASVPCADQTIEALRFVRANCCLAASRDGVLRNLALPEAKAVAEWSPTAVSYTALGIRSGLASGGPLALAAGFTAKGPQLELLQWSDASLREPPTLLAATEC